MGNAGSRAQAAEDWPKSEGLAGPSIHVPQDNSAGIQALGTWTRDIVNETFGAQQNGFFIWFFFPWIYSASSIIKQEKKKVPNNQKKPGGKESSFLNA